jgi:hypothetical protein
MSRPLHVPLGSDKAWVKVFEDHLLAYVWASLQETMMGSFEKSEYFWIAQCLVYKFYGICSCPYGMSEHYFWIAQCPAYKF